MDLMITLLSLFDKSTNASNAIDELHQLGISENAIEVITGMPYPEQSLGRHKEWLKLPYIVLAGAAVGLIFGLFLSVVTRPPAAIITFVFTMMATIVSTFLGVLWEMDFPSFKPKHYHKLTTSGQITIVLECLKEQEKIIIDILENHGGTKIHRSKKMAI